MMFLVYLKDRVAEIRRGLDQHGRMGAAKYSPAAAEKRSIFV